MILVFLLYALFASVFTVSKIALSNTAPCFLIGFRMITAGTVLLLYLLWTNRKALILRKECLLPLFFLGACNIYLTNALEFYGLQTLTSVKTCFIYSLSPFVAALLSYLLYGEVMNRRKWLGLLVGFCGITPLFCTSSFSDSLIAIAPSFSLADLSVVGAVFTGCYGWLLLKELIREKSCHPLMANGYSMLFGGLLATVQSLITEEWSPLPFQDGELFLIASIYLIIASNLIAYNLYGFLLKRFSATFLSFSGFSTFFFTALFGYFFLGETIDLPLFFSAFIVFAGLFLFYQEELKESYSRPLST